LPDISKINALAIGSVAKVDGLAKASILDIDGVAVPSAWTPLLDTYGSATAAFGTHLLRTAYTGVAMRIRRDSDDVEADVSFDSNNEVSLTSAITNASSGTYTDLADFVNHTGTPTDAYCVQWKDQSGNGYNITQDTATGSALQPQLYYASTGLFTVNGRPALTLKDSTTQGGGFDDIPAGISLSQPYTLHTVAMVHTDESNSTYAWSSLPLLFVNNSSATETAFVVGGGNATLTTVMDSTQEVQGLFMIGADSSNLELYGRTNIAEESQTTGSTVSSYSPSYIMGRRVQDVSKWTMQEVIFWPSDQLTSNKTGIRDAVNEYYSIF
jgi:hypothetical protein